MQKHFTLLFFFFLTTALYSQNIYYIKENGSGSGSGGWGNASGDLQAVINLADTNDEVWVAEGIYFPAENLSFIMKHGVALYGGFDGTESERIQRNWSDHPTILAGNGSRVITNNFTSSNPMDTTARLDGFILTGGYMAGFGNDINGSGGAMYNNWASPYIANCTFTGNSNINLHGGCLYNKSSSPYIVGCTFSNNSTTASGGAICNIGSSPQIINCLIKENSAGSGGAGLYNDSSLPTLVNCTIEGNIAGWGGAMYNFFSNPEVGNCIIYGNSTGIFNDISEPNITYSIIQGGYSGIGNLDVDPLFVSEDNQRLLLCSPAINAGNPDHSGGPGTDMIGNDRILLGRIDMGAYERSSFGEMLTEEDDTDHQEQSATQSTVYGQCESRIAAITGDGTVSSISGLTEVSVWVETSQPANYVRRHYEINPNTNAGTSTGFVTLYFSQTDFDDFNEVNTVLLPDGPTGNTSTIIIEKRGGQSSDGSGTPGSYPGTPENITPTNVVWNELSGRWEVHFSVNGFSGFFLKTQTGPLPLELLSFDVREENCRVKVDWKTSDEFDLSDFQIQTSDDGRHFNSVTTVAATNSSSVQVYTRLLDLAQSSVYFRLKITGQDGTYTFSQIKHVKLDCQNTITIYPNPTSGVIKVEGLNKPTAYVIYDVSGKVVQKGFTDDQSTIDCSRF